MASGLTQQPNHPTKRKSSGAGLPGSGRPAKRRASKACHCCRSRKVRCDVVESGIPCTNCRLDEVECVVTEGKRRKKSYVDNDCLHHSPIESVEETEEIPQFPMFDDIDGLQELSVPSKPVVREVPTLNSFEYELNHHKPHMIYQTQGHQSNSGERTHRTSTIGQQQPPPPRHSLDSPAHYSYQVPCHSSGPLRAEIDLPRYIAPIPARMLSEDLVYLQKKGVFYIPEASIRNELLRSYVQYVHPYLPLLDLQDFLSPIEKNDVNGKVSLLLFQAVMFVATAYVDMRYLTALGYTNRKSARKAFFQRVKLLYDFDWELDRVTVVQSVLLMTYWYESPNDPKDVWHWLGVAISIARTIGINHSTEDSTLDHQKRKLWKRIWWSCYIRDRLVAIGMRRPIRITEQDYDVPPLTVDDFETDALPPELCRMLGGCSAVRDGSKRVTLAKLCIAVTEVCRCITNVLNTQYSVMGHKLGITSETTVRLVPRKVGAESSEVIKCDRELEQWYTGLPLQLRFFMPGSRDRTNNHDGEVIGVHRALLAGIYLAATSALHRPQMIPVSPSLAIIPELKELSRRRVREAALDITEIFRDLYAHDLIKYLPNTGVTVILPAIIIHLLDIKAIEPVDRQASMRHFQFCMQALQKLREVYSSADFAFSFLDAATRQTDVPAPESPSEGRQGTQDSCAPSNKASGTLTPPPDNQEGSEQSRRESHKQLSSPPRARPNSVFTPPASEQSLSTLVRVDGAISLRDLENMIDIDGMSDTPLEPLSVFSLDPTPTTLQDQTCIPASSFSGMEGSSRPHSTVPNEFDQLINLDGSADLFAPTKVHLDDNLFKDIDMEWLAEPELDDDEHDCHSELSEATTAAVVEAKQVDTPRSTVSQVRAEKAGGDDVESGARLENRSDSAVTKGSDSGPVGGKTLDDASLPTLDLDIDLSV